MLRGRLVTSQPISDLWIRAATASPDAPALVDDESDAWVTHAELIEKATRWGAAIGDIARRPLVFLLAENSVEAVAVWLGACRVGAAVALVNPLLRGDDLDALLRAYQPDCVAAPGSAPDFEGFLPRRVAGTAAARCWIRGAPAGGAIDPELGALLFTSGTTGSPKAVRLSQGGLGHNTAGIIESLRLGADETALGHLRLHYSFGMSIVNSHLAVGGSIVLTNQSLAHPALWRRATRFEVTTLPGVPAQYELLHRIRFDAGRFCPSLRVMTQAGGKARSDVLDHFRDMMKARGGRFYVMYGQTEAGPRMACQELTGAGGDTAAAGWALPDGEFQILDESGRPRPPGEPGLVRYRGPGVMLGYAQCRADLSRGDENRGVLDTGDFGQLGPDGKLFIVGRSKRFAKVGGIRCNLDEIERAAARIASPAAVLPDDDSIIVFWPEDALENPREATIRLARSLGFPATAVRCRVVRTIPHLESGKTDYAALRELDAGGS
jgi:acyl-CoA synthetase (AMP-forming)/AMP-acid ligase II